MISANKMKHAMNAKIRMGNAQLLRAIISGNCNDFEARQALNAERIKINASRQKATVFMI
jgi:hypothetical protein